MSILTAVTLAGVTPIEVTLLQDAGILNNVNLGTLSVTDVDIIIPNSTIVARRRLHSIGQYVSSGGNITEATTMLDILIRINALQPMLPFNPMSMLIITHYRIHHGPLGELRNPRWWFN